MVKCESRNHACAREQFTQLYKSCVWLERCISWAVLLPFASRWMCWSRSSLSCFSRSTPPETSRASDWPTTISSATCSLSPSSSWSRYEALELYLLLNFFFQAHLINASVLRCSTAWTRSSSCVITSARWSVRAWRRWTRGGLLSWTSWSR